MYSVNPGSCLLLPATFWYAYIRAKCFPSSEHQSGYFLSLHSLLWFHHYLQYFLPEFCFHSPVWHENLHSAVRILKSKYTTNCIGSFTAIEENVASRQEDPILHYWKPAQLHINVHVLKANPSGLVDGQCFLGLILNTSEKSAILAYSLMLNISVNTLVFQTVDIGSTDPQSTESYHWKCSLHPHSTTSSSYHPYQTGDLNLVKETFIVTVPETKIWSTSWH